MKAPAQDAMMWFDMRESPLMAGAKSCEAGKWCIIDEAQRAVLHGDTDVVYANTHDRTRVAVVACKRLSAVIVVAVFLPSAFSSSAVAARHSFPLNPVVSTDASPFSIVTVIVFMT
jgi:hypothetical protein